LAQVLRYLPHAHHDAVLVDAATGDDAAVLRLGPERALVLTTDFFTPIVDDAYQFGQIAAANALSDVYAMGGRPLWCLNLVGWPRETLSLELLGEVLRGASEVVSRAGAVVVGGHSIDDPEPKFGLVVVGEVHPERATTNAAARPGEWLVLTKPIGTGVIATAIKKGAAGEAVVREAVATMTTLNAAAAEAARENGVRAVTDVTGFGLLGHLRSMLAASGAAAEVWAGAVPLLKGARELAEQGHVPGGTRRNLESLAASTEWDARIDQTGRILLADAQTSGGLLMAVRPESCPGLMAGLAARGVAAAAVVGRVVAGEPGRITVREGESPPLA
jgi:selenide,water dikinase